MPSILNSKKFIRIGIDGGDFVPFFSVRSGIQRIVDSFLKEVINLKIEKKPYFFNYYYFGQKKAREKFSFLKFKNLPRKFFSSFFLPLNFIFDKNDVFLGFSSTFPFLITPFCSKKIVFLYDFGFLKFPHFYTNFSRLTVQLKKTLSHADKIVTLSETTKKEILKSFSKESTVIYPGLDHFSWKDELKFKILDYFLFDKPFFLYVGMIKPVKNLEKIFYFFYHFVKKTKKDDFFLIIVGQKEKAYFGKLLQDPYFKRIKNQVIFEENAEDKKLFWYYHNALALLNFSYEEGFCFPVFEALYSKNFAIVNSLPVYYEFKKYFPNLIICRNEKEVVLAMEMVHVKKKKKMVGCLNPEKFSWKNFTQKLLELVES